MISPPLSRGFIDLFSKALHEAGVGPIQNEFLDIEKTVPKCGLTEEGFKSEFFTANAKLALYINAIGIRGDRLPEIVFGPAYNEAEFLSCVDSVQNPTWLSRKRPAIASSSDVEMSFADVAAKGDIRRLWGDSDSDSESVTLADKNLATLNRMIKGIKRLQPDDHQIEVPQGFIPTMGPLGEAILTAAKLVGVNIKESQTAFIATGNTIIPKLGLVNPELKDEEILLVELIRGLHAVRPLDASATKAELALAFMYGTAYQRFHYDMNAKSVAPCLKSNRHHVDNMITALQKISPRSDIFGNTIMNIVNTIISSGVAKQVAASESKHHFLDPEVWEAYVKTLYVSDSTLVEKLYPVATKKRLTRDAKKKANNPGFKARDKDYESYQGVVKPEIDVSRVTLAADEKIAVKAVNQYLQNAANEFKYSKADINQVSRKKEAIDYINALQTKAKAVTTVAQRRKGIVHARIVATRLANNDEERYAPSREEWDHETQNELNTEHKVLDAIKQAFGAQFVISLIGQPT
jgi:hypothetical protein